MRDERQNAAARVTVANRILEASKWLGLLLMPLDHINKYPLGDGIP